MFSFGPTGLDPPAEARIRRKKEISKIRGGGLFLCSKSKTRDSPDCHPVLAAIETSSTIKNIHFSREATL